MTNPLTVLSLAQLRERTSAKWRRYDADVLPLWVAEMDVPLAAPIVAALQRAIEIGDSGYAQRGLYAQAMSDFARRRWGWSFDPACCAEVADVMAGIVELLELLTTPGEAVIVNSPVYTPFYRFAEAIGRAVIEAPLGEDDRLDIDALESSFRKATAGGANAAYLLCSPHNPTGTVHTRAELEAVAELSRRHRVAVVADEIHAPIVYAGHDHLPYLSLPECGRAFALLSASKGWNLAGLKGAVAVAGADGADQLAWMQREGGRHGPSHFGVIAHVAALAHAGDWLDGLLTGLDENRRLLRDLLDTRLPTVGYREPQGTYLAWLDCRPLGLGDDPAAVFLERGRVALSSGPSFGSGGGGHVRLNLATSPEIIGEAIERMVQALR